jgi:Ca2+-binding RTX toxin-like protein
MVMALATAALLAAGSAGAAVTPVEPAAPTEASIASLAEQAAEIPTPSCAEGPTREGEVIVGTPCADRIVVPPTVSYVDGGPGDDTIIGSITTAASGNCEVAPGCHLEAGSQTFEGGAGDDLVYGDRGNDILRGNAGDDRLYGGIGDDRLEGGPGNDWLSGGFGSDTIDGGEGNDYVRGDGTIDHIFDTGGGYDTLSFADAGTPGFGSAVETGATNFPPGKEGERGVYLNLAAGKGAANNGVAGSGGGVDDVQAGVFERIIGSPFSDYIVGTPAAEEIFGGGGADVIRGGGGADVIHGGADGDLLEASPGSTLDGGAGADNCVGTGVTETSCGGTAQAVVVRNSAKVSVGETDAGSGSTDVYLVGSNAGETVTATYGTTAVTFAISGSSFAKDAAETDAGGCVLGPGTEPTTATCPLGTPAAPNVPPLDAILLAGMGGADTINANGFPDGSSVVELGGAGGDTLNGGASEDVLVDDPPGNPSQDFLHAFAGDDALIHDGGPDLLDGGEGSDLFLSVSICDGETIDGGTSVGGDRDNASWAKLEPGGVDARLDLDEVGFVGEGEAPVCPTGTLDRLEGIEDLEGSNGNDVLYGDEGVNQLLGHKGEDTYRALGGNDTIFANSGTVDKVIDCGEGTEDLAVIDEPPVIDPTPIGCERVRQGKAEEFETEISEPQPAPLTPLPTPPVTPAPAPKPKVDRVAPRTKLLRHPAKLVRVAPHHLAAFAFRFAASEKSRFECKLDAKQYRSCRSPLRAHLKLGAHTFRVYAIDTAGNRDKTPALFKLRVVTLKRHHR